MWVRYLHKKTIEEYMEIIYILEKRDGRAHTTRIAAEKEVSAPTVTEMLDKLQKEGYIEYEKFRGAKLTPSGMDIAKKLMNKHQVIADFFEIIGIERNLAEIDACQIEHYVHKKTMVQLGRFVEFVNDAPEIPRWLEHYKQFCETGDRGECDDCVKNRGNK